MLDSCKYKKELNHFLGQSHNILLICHVNPDGDAIGSMIALGDYLQKSGKKVNMISPNYLQEFIKWMDGVEDIMIYTKQRKLCDEIISSSDLIIMLDFNQSNRLGEAEKTVMKTNTPKIIIDHHLDSGSFHNLLISDPLKCSTSEIVYEIVTCLNGGDYHTDRFAEAIYVGIITDTGNFEHGNFTGTTFRIMAELLDKGIDKVKIFNKVFNNFEESRLRLMGYALYEKMVILPEYRASYIVLTKKELDRYGYSKGDTEGFVNMPLSLKDVDFSTIIIEKDDYIKFSFRSKGEFPVNSFAQKYFGGGGHYNAAGGDYYDSLENAVKYFLESLKNFRGCEE